MDETTEPLTPYALVCASIDQHVTKRGWDIPRAARKLERFCIHFGETASDSDARMRLEELCAEARSFLRLALQMEEQMLVDDSSAEIDHVARLAMPFRESFHMIFGCLPVRSKDPLS